jgi:hypothetical protein
MKSALANIGETGLSTAAFKLEQAGRAEDISVLMSETPVFLEALREVIDKNKPQNDDGDAVQDDSDENQAYLSEKLLVIQKACEDYDEMNANAALAELRQKKWSKTVEKLLDSISEYLLHSDFEEAMSIVREYTKNSLSFGK